MTNTRVAVSEGGELLPCPFCDDDECDFVEGADDDGQWVAVVCTKCGAGSRQHYAVMGDARPHAQNAWNTRFGEGDKFSDYDAYAAMLAAALAATSSISFTEDDVAHVRAGGTITAENGKVTLIGSDALMELRIKLDRFECAATSSDAGREVEAIDRCALKTKLDALIVAASREWGVGSTEHNLVRDISDAVARAPVLARAGGDGWRTETTWEVWEDDLMVASADSEKEARHYFAVYSQDGPVRLVKAETRRLDITPAAPDAEVL